MAIAGALVAAPQAANAATASAKPAATVAAHQPATNARATLDSASTRTAAQAGTTARQHASGTTLTTSTHYTVRSGDTLAKIASDYYHKASDWQWLYHENDSRISNPDVIYPGQSLYVPADPPANYTLPDYQPRHANAAVSDSDDSSSSDSSSVVPQSASASASAGSGSTSLSGTLSCSGLEQLWENAGGNPADAVTAASVAMAESGGNQYAVSPTDDYGYWQINASNGSLATTDPYGNARAAIQLSDDGANWDAWTTYTSGAYAGQC
ncbi:MAG: LysM peptidoglycan-binding domain-containing protein [Nocardiopsaceae bacterium]|nr:LysM peptidoglycan-binding domain-containing protein [Nocardiopsaceae bacterium]